MLVNRLSLTSFCSLAENYTFTTSLESKGHLNQLNRLHFRLYGKAAAKKSNFVSLFSFLPRLMLKLRKQRTSLPVALAQSSLYRPEFHAKSVKARETLIKWHVCLIRHNLAIEALSTNTTVTFQKLVEMFKDLFEFFLAITELHDRIFLYRKHTFSFFLGFVGKTKWALLTRKNSTFASSLVTLFFLIFLQFPFFLCQLTWQLQIECVTRSCEY